MYKKFFLIFVFVIVILGSIAISVSALTTICENPEGCTGGGAGGASTPTLTFSASPTSVTQDQAVTLTWTSTSATSCTASGDWSGTKAVSGSQSMGTLTASKTYSLTCTGTGGSVTKSAEVTFSNVKYYFTTANVLRDSSSGYVGKYYANCASSTPWIDCNRLFVSATSSQVWVDWFGSEVGNYIGETPSGTGLYVTSLGGLSTSSISSSQDVTGVLIGGTNSSPTYSVVHLKKVNFSGNFNATSASSVAFYKQTPYSAPTYPVPTCTLSASPSTIDAGSSSTLTWRGLDAYNCWPSWSAMVANSGTKSVSPSTTTDYSIQCIGFGGSCNASTKVTVNTASTLAISASPTTITNSSGTSTITINSSNINGNVYLTPDRGSVIGTVILPASVPGNATNIITSTTTTLSLSNVTKGGTVTILATGTGLNGSSVPPVSTTVTINIPPSGTLSATDCIIAANASTCSSSVSWTTSNLISGASTSITKDKPDANTFVYSPTTPTGTTSNSIEHGTTNFWLYHNGTSLASDPATASCISGTQWDGTKCSVPTCGSANGVSSYTAPTTNLCSVGTASSVTGTGPWNWSCAGSNGGSASCSANKITDPICAAAHYGCAAGTSSSNVNGSTAWTWVCTGVNTAKTVSCSESKDSIQGNILATTCSIPLNNSTCMAKTTWSTSGLSPSSTTEVTHNNPDGTHVSSLTSGTNIDSSVTYGQTTFFIYNSEKVNPLASASINVTCASGGWDGTKCAATPVNGGWSAWSPASCPTACGEPASTLSRTCTNPTPANGGASCSGSSTQSCPATASCAQNLPELSASVPNPTTANINQARTFSSTITNSGNTSSGSSFINLFQTATGAGGTGTITDYPTASMSTLVSGGTAVATKAITFTSAGRIYIRACADKSSAANTGTIAELDDNNNCSEWAELVISAPLSVTATLTATPSSIKKGESSTLDWSSSASATSCQAMGFSTNNATSGSVVVAPTVTSTYNLICRDDSSGSSAVDEATVTVTVTSGGKKPIYKEN